MLVAIMAQQLLVPGAQNDAVTVQKPESLDVARIGPASASISVGLAGFARTPQREAEGGAN